MYYFRKSIEVNPSDVQSVLQLKNNILLSKKKYLESITLCKKFLQIDSVNSKIYYQMGYSYLLNKQFDTARNQFNTCLQLKDSSRAVLKGIGIACFRMDSFATAKIALEKAYFMNTTDVNTLEYFRHSLLSILL